MHIPICLPFHFYFHSTQLFLQKLSLHIYPRPPLAFFTHKTKNEIISSFHHHACLFSSKRQKKKLHGKMFNLHYPRSSVIFSFFFVLSPSYRLNNSYLSLSLVFIPFFLVVVTLYNLFHSISSAFITFLFLTLKNYSLLLPAWKCLE